MTIGKPLILLAGILFLIALAPIGSADTNTAYGKTVSINGFSIVPTLTENIVDNNFSTCSEYSYGETIADDSDYIQIDLGQIYNLFELKFKVGYYSGMMETPIYVTIKVSSNNIDWILLGTYTASSTDEHISNVSFTNINNVRYIRSTTYVIILGEFSVVRWYEIQAWIPPLSITSWNNSINGDSLYPHIDINENINFDVVASQTITTWHWKINNETVSNNYDNLTTLWSSAGNKKVTVYGENELGITQTITWLPIVLRTKSTYGETHETLNETGYNSMIDSMEGNSPDFVAFLMATIFPFTVTAMIGNLFWIFLYGLPLAAIWIRQEKAIMPAFLGILFGTFFLGQLPGGFVGPAVLFIILTIVGLIYSLVRER